MGDCQHRNTAEKNNEHRITAKKVDETPTPQFNFCLHVNHADTDDGCILAVANILSYVHDDKDELVTFPLPSAVVVATSSLA